MTIKELKQIIKDISDNHIIKFCVGIPPDNVNFIIFNDIFTVEEDDNLISFYIKDGILT